MPGAWEIRVRRASDALHTMRWGTFTARFQAEGSERSDEAVVNERQLLGRHLKGRELGCVRCAQQQA